MYYWKIKYSKQMHKNGENIYIKNESSKLIILRNIIEN